MNNSSILLTCLFLVFAVAVVFVSSGIVYGDVLTGRFDVDVGQKPYEIALDTEYGWVTNNGSNNVTRISKTDVSTQTISVGTAPRGIAVDDQYVWVANYGGNTVTRISKADLTTTTISVASQPEGVAVDDDYVWVACNGNAVGKVTRIKKSTLLTTEIMLGGYCRHIVVDDNHVWVTRGSGWNMARINKSDLTSEVLGIYVGSDYGMVGDSDYLWVVTSLSKKIVTRVKKSDLSTTDIDVGVYPECIAGNDNYIWTGGSIFDDALVRVTKSNLTTESFSIDFDFNDIYLYNGFLAIEDNYLILVNNRGNKIHVLECAESGKTTWYLAEGATLGSFDEWVLIQNPTTIPAKCRVTFMKPDGSTKVLNPTINPTSRYTIKVNDYVPDESVSTMVLSTNGVEVIAERAMYWDVSLYTYSSPMEVPGWTDWTFHYEEYMEWVDGHCSAGVNKTATTWYLAEGATLGSFDEWVLIQNPNSTPANCRVTFMKPDGSTVVRYLTVNPTSRYTIHVNDHVPNESVSTMVESTNGVGIIAERAMYWDAGDYEWAGGHCSAGVTEPATTWYLAEGATLGTFDEWVLIQNPNDTPADCRITFMKPDGSTVVRYATVPKTGRYTIRVNDHVPNESVSTMVESTNGVGIIAERAMYWDAGDVEWAGGHCSAGVTEPATTWYLAEGATLGTFDEWVLIQNPNDTPVDCRITFMKPNGDTVVRYATVPKTGRYTIKVNDHVPNESVSTVVESAGDLGVIVERSMYWDGDIKYRDYIDRSYIEYGQGYTANVYERRFEEEGVLDTIEWIGGHCSTGVK